MASSIGRNGVQVYSSGLVSLHHHHHHHYQQQQPVKSTPKEGTKKEGTVDSYWSRCETEQRFLTSEGRVEDMDSKDYEGLRHCGNGGQRRICIEIDANCLPCKAVPFHSGILNPNYSTKPHRSRGRKRNHLIK